MICHAIQVPSTWKFFKDYKLHLPSGLTQFCCLWKIYTCLVTPNCARNDVITYTSFEDLQKMPRCPDLVKEECSNSLFGLKVSTCVQDRLEERGGLFPGGRNNKSGYYSKLWVERGKLPSMYCAFSVILLIVHLENPFTWHENIVFILNMILLTMFCNKFPMH